MNLKTFLGRAAEVKKGANGENIAVVEAILLLTETGVELLEELRLLNTDPDGAEVIRRHREALESDVELLDEAEQRLQVEACGTGPIDPTTLVNDPNRTLDETSGITQADVRAVLGKEPNPHEGGTT